ncbi:MAG: hypothetical protein WCD76_01175, partial [Pyrinomonadaceae bacterium]
MRQEVNGDGQDVEETLNEVSNFREGDGDLIINIKRLIKFVCVYATLCCILNGCGGTKPQVVETGTAAEQVAASPTSEVRRACPPKDLQGRLEEIARVTGGPVGAGVMLVETGESV